MIPPTASTRALRGDCVRIQSWFAERSSRYAIESYQYGTQALEKTGIGNDQVDWLIPHQANIRIIEAATQRFGIPMEKTVINLDRYGNTSAGTIPLALHEAVNDGRIRDGQQLLLVAFGGGLSWAACTMKWWAGTPTLKPAQARQEVPA